MKKLLNLVLLVALTNQAAYLNAASSPTYYQNEDVIDDLELAQAIALSLGDRDNGIENMTEEQDFFYSMVQPKVILEPAVVSLQSLSEPDFINVVASFKKKQNIEQNKREKLRSIARTNMRKHGKSDAQLNNALADLDSQRNSLINSAITQKLFTSSAFKTASEALDTQEQKIVQKGIAYDPIEEAMKQSVQEEVEAQIRRYRNTPDPTEEEVTRRVEAFLAKHPNGLNG